MTQTAAYCTQHDWRKHGYDRKGRQRVKCRVCGISTTKQLENWTVNRLSKEKHEQIFALLATGQSIRTIARLVGVAKQTVTHRRAVLLSDDIHEPTPSPGGCDYCGAQITKKKEADRRTARTRHKFCDSDCYQKFSLWNDVNRLTNILERKLKYGKVKNKR